MSNLSNHSGALAFTILLSWVSSYAFSALTGLAADCSTLQVYCGYAGLIFSGYFWQDTVQSPHNMVYFLWNVHAT